MRKRQRKKNFRTLLRRHRPPKCVPLSFNGVHLGMARDVVICGFGIAPQYLTTPTEPNRSTTRMLERMGR